MSPFWNSLFEHVKDCGRDATLFLITLAGLLGALVGVAIICLNDWAEYVVRALPVLGLFAVIWAFLAIRRARARRRQRLQRKPLSDDELRVARSKLKRDHPLKDRHLPA
ncbi:MAG: hypothetical protein DME25_21380 [Verrucomicrobia bacterium]|nr:MAG: hypothetical protein DME25_21380 [Verrucomicrobiota bacterium]